MIHLPIALSIDFVFFLIGFLFVLWLVFRHNSKFNPRYQNERLTPKQVERINRYAERFSANKRDEQSYQYQSANLLNEYKKLCKLYDTQQIDKVAFELKLAKLLENMELELDFMNQ